MSTMIRLAATKDLTPPPAGSEYASVRVAALRGQENAPEGFFTCFIKVPKGEFDNLSKLAQAKTAFYAQGEFVEISGERAFKADTIYRLTTPVNDHGCDSPAP